MVAIWPAGPPKLTKPSSSQKRNASPNGTAAASAAGASVARTVIPAPSQHEDVEHHRHDTGDRGGGDHPSGRLLPLHHAQHERREREGEHAAAGILAAE